jgi:hypothetical protein
MGIIINNPATATATSGIGRNFFKNAGFSVIQESASGTLPNSLALPTASLGYPGESEWCIAASGGTPTYAFSAANQTLTFTGAAGITDLFLLQRIESRDANRLASKQVTLSIELSNSLRPTVSWELYRPTTTADTHGTIASPTQTLIASGTWTVTSTLTRYSTTVTLPSQVSNGLEVRIKNSQQTSGTWVIARPKLEEGSSATAFTCDGYATELAKCQRHFFSLPATPQGFPCPNTGGFAATYNYPFKVTMFQAPAVVPTYTGTSNVSTLGTPVVTANGFSTQIVGTIAGNTIWTISANCSAHIP